MTCRINGDVVYIDLCFPQNEHVTCMFIKLLYVYTDLAFGHESLGKIVVGFHQSPGDFRRSEQSLPLKNTAGVLECSYRSQSIL